MLTGHKPLLLKFRLILWVILDLILLVSCINPQQSLAPVETRVSLLATTTPKAIPNPTSTAAGKISGEKPAPRSDAAMSYDVIRQMIVLVGGSTQNETYRDVWEYDGQGWNLIATDSLDIGFAPLMTYDEYRHKLVLFDWQSVSIWEYDDNRWELIQTKTRIAHLNWPAMTYNPLLRKIMIVGEWGDGKAYETWLYDGVDLERIDSSHPYLDWSSQDYDWSGQARGVDRIIFPGLAYDPNNHEIILQPTYSWTFALQDNIWGVRLTWQESALPNCGFRMFCIVPKLVLVKNRNRIVLFDGEHTWEYAGKNWVKIETAISPPRRTGHTMAYDEARGVVVLFGGSKSDGEDLNDLWEYDGVTWVER
jgi:hypothetical protein